MYRMDDSSRGPGTGRGPGGGGKRGSESRTVAEFARRGARLLQRQREHFPAEQCEPQLVALENLQAGGEFISPLDPGVECVQVWGTPMLPVWLDLTMDGRLQLALVRAVSVETSEYCTLQGVLLDWGRHRPDWLLLHFQASVTQGWSSPQLDIGAEFVGPLTVVGRVLPTLRESPLEFSPFVDGREG